MSRAHVVFVINYKIARQRFNSISIRPMHLKQFHLFYNCTQIALLALEIAAKWLLSKGNKCTILLAIRVLYINVIKIYATRNYFIRVQAQVVIYVLVAPMHTHFQRAIQV